MKIAHEAFDLKTVAESITSIIYPQAVEKGLLFTVPLIELTETVMIGDAMRLNQILLNLLSNSLKFTPKGGTIRLEIRQIQRKRSRVRLGFTVCDTGYGMSREFMKRLFTRLNRRMWLPDRSSGNRSWNGNYQESGDADGRNNLREKRIGEGTAFSVELDFDIPESSDNTEEQKPPAMESLKVLVSDDDRNSCIHASLLLKNLGIRSDWVLTGEQCVEKVRIAHQMGEEYDVCLVT